MPHPSHGEEEAEQGILHGLRLALAVSVVILLLEAVGAYLSRSLSLTVDAVHNVPDLVAFALSASALSATQRGTSESFTFGHHRREVFAGLLNGGLVLATGVAFAYEALLSLATHAELAGAVDPLWILLVALPTLGLRLLNLRWLGHFPGRIRDLNLASVLVHLASDVAITGALLADALLLLWRPTLGSVDALAALVISGILVYESLPLFRQGWEVLTERVPRGLSLEALEKSALSVPGVSEVHDLHVWSVCSSLVCLTAHVGVQDMSVHDSMDVVRELRQRMAKEFGIVHATFELECPHASG